MVSLQELSRIAEIEFIDIVDTTDVQTLVNRE